jgi:hypothetical protein
MAVGANSYGTAAQVAAFTRRYTNAGTYDVSTNPTLAQVETWINQISGTINVLLAEKGFAVPVTQADAKLSLESLVVTSVSDLCHSANGAGRFFTDRALERGVSPNSVISREIAAWIDEHTAGLEAIGVARSTANSGKIGYRDGDENGSEVSPLFGRNSFGADPRYGR